MSSEFVLHTRKENNSSSDKLRMSAWYWCMILFVIMVFLSSCQQSKTQFSSGFSDNQSRVWIGPQYWANPMQDWRLTDDRIECFVSGGNRNLFLLTYELDGNPAGFKMIVNAGRLHNSNDNGDNEELSKGWIGFKLGVRGDYEDYRDNALRGDGFPVGLTTDGKLFIGSLENLKELKDIDIDFDDFYLEINVKPGADKQTVAVLLYDESKSLISQIEAEVKSDWLIGGVALACSAGDIPESIAGRSDVVYGNWGTRPGTKRQGNVKFWFKDWKLSGDKLMSFPERSFGPILFTQYTLSDNVLRLTAQMIPHGDRDNQITTLEVFKDEKWQSVAESGIDPLSRTSKFELASWNYSDDILYRVKYDCFTGSKNADSYFYEGTIRKEPWDKEEIVVAGFTGNNDLGFPNQDILEGVKYMNPDFLFFSGDQIYEGVGGFGIQIEPLETACLDYLRKWYLYGWAYGDILKDRPTVAIPDDHDVYHGNIWGAGGIATPDGLGGAAAQDKGGYKMNPEWVNMVQRTQTSHLPESYDPTPVSQDISVYYTSINYAGISFAVLEDRKFKSAPAVVMPEAKIVNGWSKNTHWDAAVSGDVPGAVLLGKRQLSFLDNWASDWSDSIWMKVVLSQTIFANVATLPEDDARTDANVPKLRILNKDEYALNDIPVQDHDSNGWPQSPRNKALEKVRKAYAFHLAGDQHLGSVIEYGVSEYNDAGYAFCVPSISNVWPRRWFPNVDGKNRNDGDPRYTGDFLDGFGNKMTVKAVSNPVFTGKVPSHLYDRATGFGIVRFNRETRDITMECWPRVSMPSSPDAEQYSGWPVTINQLDNYLTKASYALPRIKVPHIKNAVIQVIREATGEIIYTIRISGHVFKPPVLEKGLYSFSVGEPGTSRWKTFTSVEAIPWHETREFIVGFE
ncbi:MAG: twin-arginine translocation pathway signal protein [Bacteroidetes bacterium]|nr:twin-arginine translocation pathway signal protein [Bacteroidota bacterium]